MQVFKTFFLLTKRNIGIICMYFGIFFVLAFVITNSSPSAANQDFKETSTTISIVDNDQSKLSKACVDFLSKKHKIVDIGEDAAKRQDALYNDFTKYILTIPEGFEKEVLAGNRKNLLSYNTSYTGANYSEFINVQTNEFLSIVSTYLTYGYELSDAIDEANATLEKETKVTLTQSESKLNMMSIFFSYIPYILICVLLCGIGPVLMLFHEKEIEKRNLCSPMSATKQALWLGLATGIFSFICLLAFLVPASILYGSSLFSETGILYTINTVVFLLIALALTIIVSSLAKNVNMISVMSNILGLGMSFLGGIFVPLEILPKQVLTFSQFLPTYWYTKAIGVLDSYAGSAQQIKQYQTAIGIQLLFVAALFAVALLINNKKRLK